MIFKQKIHKVIMIVVFPSVATVNWFCLFHLVLVPPIPLTMLMPHMTFWVRVPISVSDSGWESDSDSTSFPFPDSSPIPVAVAVSNPRDQRLAISDR